MKYKTGDYVSVSKINQVESPLFKSADKSKFIYGENNFGVSLPIDYVAEGTLIHDVRVGYPIVLDRNKRNDVVMPGLMKTSTVTKIDGDNIHTLNSIYKITLQDKPKKCCGKCNCH